MTGGRRRRRDKKKSIYRMISRIDRLDRETGAKLEKRKIKERKKERKKIRKIKKNKLQIHQPPKKIQTKKRETRTKKLRRP